MRLAMCSNLDAAMAGIDVLANNASISPNRHPRKDRLDIT